MFETEDSFYFALAPEGTRALKGAWKSGFYRIAIAARVPVFFGALDYGNKRIGITGRIDLTGDVDADLAEIAQFYASIEGRRPEMTTPVRFAEQKKGRL